MSLLLPLVSNLTILDTAGRLRRFTPNHGQRLFINEIEEQFRERGRARIIVLKARQVGFSTATEAVYYRLAQVYPNYNGLVMAHSKDTARAVFEMTKRFADHDPFAPLYTLDKDSAGKLSWATTGSSLEVATAGNPEAGRGTTRRFIHSSEAAFYAYPEATIRALRNALHPSPGSVGVIESTANGVGNAFHVEWLRAESGDSDYRPFFYAWWQHPAYRGSLIGEPPVLRGYTEDERVLMRAFGVDEDQLAWRRWKIKDLNGDLLSFHQEYPSEPEEAFLSTGTNVFQQDLLRSVYAPQVGYQGVISVTRRGREFVRTSEGPLTVFKAPAPNRQRGQYIIGADPSGSIHGDYAVAQVFNRLTLEQVAVYRRRVEPRQFAIDLADLGHYYNTALIAPEATGPGQLVIGGLLGAGYPNLFRRVEKLDRTPGTSGSELWGWWTNTQTKFIAIGKAQGAISSGEVTIHDEQTFTELSNYVVKPDGSYGNGNGTPHDDTVMSFAIAMAAHEMTMAALNIELPVSRLAVAEQAADPVAVAPKASDLVELGLDHEFAASLPGVLDDMADDSDPYYTTETDDFYREEFSW